MMPAHCLSLSAPVPLSVSKSINTSSEWRRKGLYPLLRSASCRYSSVVILIGSTILIRNGSASVRIFFTSCLNEGVKDLNVLYSFYDINQHVRKVMFFNHT